MISYSAISLSLGALSRQDVQRFAQAARGRFVPVVTQVCQYSDASASTAEPESKTEADVHVLKAVLNQFVPGDEFQEAHRVAQVPKVRFGDLPATSRLVDSLVPDKPVREPVYDLPTWIENNYPQHDTLPRSPFYHWETYLAQSGLPDDQQQVYLVFHKYMTREKYRRGIMRQAAFELSRLWDWQHRRLAAGLSVEPLHHLDTTAATTAGNGSGAVVAGDAAVRAPKTAPEAQDAVPAPAPAMGMAAFLSEVAAAPSSVPRVSAVAAAKPTSDQLMATLTDEERDYLWEHKWLLQGGRLEGLSQRFSQRINTAVRNLPTQTLQRSYVGQVLHKEHYNREVDGAEESALFSSRQEDPINDKHTGFLKKQIKGFRAPTPPSAADVAAALSSFEAELRAASHWADTSLISMDVQAQEQLQTMEEDLERRRRELQLSITRHQDHGYTFELSRRPPTPTFDMLVDYLDLKYQDLQLKKAASDSLMTGIMALRVAEGGEQQEADPAAHLAARRLSPLEREELNTRADELFRDNPLEYISFVEGLYGDGLISRGEMSALVAAARRRGAELEQQRQEAAGQGGRVQDVDRDELLSVLGGGVEPLWRLSDTERASAVWSEGSRQYGAWAASMKAAARKDLEAMKVAGLKLSAAQEAELAAVWDSPVSFTEARRLWREGMELAGAAAPASLEEVLLADKLLRTTAPGSEQQAAALSQVQQLEARLSQAQRQFQATTGQALPPWSQVVSSSAALDLNDFAALKNMFAINTLQDALRRHWEDVSAQFMTAHMNWQAPPTWDDMYALMKRVYVHALEQDAAALGSGGTGSYPLAGLSPAAAEFLPLMQESDLALLRAPGGAEDLRGQPGSSRDDGGTGGAEASGPLAEAVAAAKRRQSQADTEEAGAAADGAAVSSGWPRLPASEAGPDNLVWAEQVRRLQQLSRVAHEDVAATLTHPPPYPGAQRVIRWEQTFVLHAAAAEMDHPKNRRVVLRVHAHHLQRETGLSDLALQYVLKILHDRPARHHPDKDIEDPEYHDSWYEPATGDINLRCSLFPNREENRKWCLEKLHELIYEGQRRFPSDTFLFNTLRDNPYAPPPPPPCVQNEH